MMFLGSTMIFTIFTAKKHFFLVQPWFSPWFSWFNQWFSPFFLFKPWFFLGSAHDFHHFSCLNHDFLGSTHDFHHFSCLNHDFLGSTMIFTMIFLVQPMIFTMIFLVQPMILSRFSPSFFEAPVVFVVSESSPRLPELQQHPARGGRRAEAVELLGAQVLLAGSPGWGWDSDHEKSGEYRYGI